MEKKSVLFDYFLLLAAGLMFLAFLSFFQADKTYKFLTIAGFIIFYIFWAIHHHSRNQTLQFKNVIEYVLIGFSILIIARIIFLF